MVSGKNKKEKSLTLNNDFIQGGDARSIQIPNNINPYLSLL